MSPDDVNRAIRRRRAIAVCALAATGLELTVPIWAGLQTPGYNHLHQYISELAERGAPVGPWVSLGGFVPVGTLIVAFLLLLWPTLPRTRRTVFGVVASMGVGVGYIVAGLAPCDPGCPTGGSGSQRLHTLAGYYHYGGAIVGLALFRHVFRTSNFGVSWRSVTTCALVFAAAGAVGMMFLPHWKGGFQRLAEFGFFGWTCFVALAPRNHKQIDPVRADIRPQSQIR